MREHAIEQQYLKGIPTRFNSCLLLTVEPKEQMENKCFYFGTVIVCLI